MPRFQHLEKVVSGGQDGVDQAALRAALEAGLEIGGWCPPGRLCESGTIPEAYPLLETPRERSALGPEVPRSLRTEWNVRDSDATLILARRSVAASDPGTAFTALCAEHHGRPLLVCDPEDGQAIASIAAWLAAHEVRTLNVAGPAESACPGVGGAVHRVLLAVLGDLRARPGIV